ncbi:sugar kinase [Flectobacillus major]|uniref:sugar kinase n=1 Tax=Flectobacillus major TaxID=103 RepID=UPI0004286D4D|nr:sugar kinase [Flectobacillus major]
MVFQPPQIVAFGELLMRLSCPNGLRFNQTDSFDAYYAGAEANVCVLLSRLGVDTRLITRLPANELGYTATEHLQKQRVDTSKILFEGQKIGLYFTENGNGIRSTRVIYDRKNSSFSQLQKGQIDWKTVLRGASVFHWSGIAAAVSASAAQVCEEAIEAAVSLGITISVDFNYRSTLWDYGKLPSEIMPKLLEKSQIVVADLDSAKVYFGIETNIHASLEERFEQCTQLLKTYMPHLSTLAMSFRKSGENLLHHYSGAIMHQNTFQYSKTHILPHITDQIGSGDSFTGGLLYAILQQYSPAQSIEFATACGVIKQSIRGDFAVIRKEEVEQLIVAGISGRIIR